MTRVFVYEYCVAVGPGRGEPSDPGRALYHKGRAMRDAVADDFRRAGCEVVTLELPADATEEDHNAAIGELAAAADATLVIAPEIDGLLEWACWPVWESDGRLLGGTVESVQLTSNKLLLAEHWAKHGVPTPKTTPAGKWPPDRFPCVVKPADGAGSETTFLARDGAELDAARRAADAARPGAPMIAQDFAPGRPASVAFLVGPGKAVPLAPTWQHLTDDGRFGYRGGELPVPREFATRAVAAARKAVGCVPGLAGYVGVDVVLGDAADGSADVAIEVNPRLTTSYVGLRALADFNIAAALLRVLDGDDPGPMPWKPGPVRFRYDGGVG